jgi:HipA-like protein
MIGVDMEILYIWAPPFLVGELCRADDDQASFRYCEEWIDNPKHFALSFSLKLIKDKVYFKEAENYFENLLPEGNARESLCRNT